MFGKEKGCYFNPYTASQMNEKNCPRIDRPNAIQIGRSGFLIHESMGLRDDYDYFLDIRVSANYLGLLFFLTRLNPNYLRLLFAKLL